MTRASDLAKVLSGGTISTADNGTQLTLESTDTDANAGPHLRLYRSVAGADSDNLGQIEFSGQDDAGNEFKYAQIESFLVDASNGTEDGYLEFQVGHGGTERVSRLLFSGTEAVINQDSKDLDFRVESNGNANMLVVDGGNDKVGIGTNTPARQLTVQNTIANSGGELGLLSSDSSTTGQFGTLHFGNNTDTSLASIRATADGSTTAGKLEFNTEPNGGAIATRMTIDSSGDVGIGAEPNNYGSMTRVLEISAASDVQLALHATSDSIADGNRIGEVAFLAGSDSTLPNVATIVGRVNGTSENQGILSFHTRHTDTGGLPAERLRINEQGMFMLNGTNEIARLVISQDTQSLNMCFLQNTNSTTGGNYFVFSNSGGSTAGTINQNGSTTVAYNTSSDYRLKENVSYDFDATARLKQLKPARFNWIEDETNTLVDGFLAHEVSSIVPEAITGEKDATKDVPNVVLNEDGTVKAQGISEEDWTQGKSDGIYANDTTWVDSKNIIDAQGIDQSKLVPLLVKTIQELEARITALESA